jgi:hypothetical protein
MFESPNRIQKSALLTSRVDFYIQIKQIILNHITIGLGAHL